MTDDLTNRFTYHPPANKEVVLQHETIRNMGYTLAKFVDESVPDGREKALAITKIEEAVMWANAALARSGGE